MGEYGAAGGVAGYGDYGLHLEAYPWDKLASIHQRASQFGVGQAGSAAGAAGEYVGAVDLSIGTPVDPTPDVVQRALAHGADSHGYPTTAGTPELREAISGWYRTWRGVDVSPDAVLPTVGSKELVAWLPTLLGLRGLGLGVAGPAVAYPTYRMGATIAGVDFRVCDADQIIAGASLDGVGLLWLNSPANPTGRVLSVETLRAVVEAARSANVVVASDECYCLLTWEDARREGDAPAVSILDERVSGGDHTGLLSVYSLSKQSNMAGYRAAFVGGDLGLVKDLTNSRKHAGMMVPGPVQTAMCAVLTDREHVTQQKERYRQRRAALKAAVEAWGMRVDYSQAGLYLWCTRGEDCWVTLERLAERGIVAGPGAIYGSAGAEHVRIALTGTDEAIEAAVTRLRH